MQAIEIPDNPSPLNFFAVPSHTAFICGLSLLQAHNIRLNDVVDDNLIAHKVGNYNDVLISNNSNEKSSTLLIYKNHSNKEEIRKSYCDVIEVDNTSILLNFVEQGVGLGVIPNYLLKGSSHQELLKVTHTYSTEKSMYVAYPYQNPLPRKLAEISSFIRLELTAILGEK